MTPFDLSHFSADLEASRFFLLFSWRQVKFHNPGSLLQKTVNFLTRRMAHGVHEQCPPTSKINEQSHVTTETVMTQFCDCQIVSGTLMKLPHPTRGKQKTTCWSPPVGATEPLLIFFVSLELVHPLVVFPGNMNGMSDHDNYKKD